MKMPAIFSGSMAAAAALAMSATLLNAAEPASKAAPEVIPASSRRPVVIELDASEVQESMPGIPRVHVPEGYELSVAAAAPLVTHPIAGGFDDRGRLFLADAVGVNWKKAELEADPPNRVLMLEDTDKDGRFDRSTIFADGMTFPQGAQWLDGSLFVASPPGIWKLTDTDGDGVADEREMIVSGFEYTGNAADVHGPFLHPNGRLYWCHGRKGYRVTDREGKVIHEGLSSGIWSAKPDGSDVQWHSLLAGDNPVEVDFTAQGDVIGVQNIYHHNPRGDTVVHWLYGGVYERADMMRVLAGLPRTLDTMPVMHNFGHVAVSGSCFWKRYEGAGDEEALQFVVTHFNTQRLVRMELTRDGSTYRARENEFLKIEDPDVHFTDVIEDADGSLLVLDTGGWFRIGCPASLMAKPGKLGAVYRVHRKGGAGAELATGWQAAYRPPASSTKGVLVDLASADPHVRLRALSHIAESNLRDPGIGDRLVAMMGETLDAPLEHALLCAAQTTGAVSSVEVLLSASSPAALRRMLVSFSAGDEAALKQGAAIAREHLDSPDEDLGRAALQVILQNRGMDEAVVPMLQDWLTDSRVPAARLRAVRGYCAALIADVAAQQLITAMLDHESRPVRQVALEILAAQNLAAANPDWLPALKKALAEDNGPTPLLLDALKKLKTPGFDSQLLAIAADERRPAALRLKALNAMQSRKVTPETFAMLQSTLTTDHSAAARIQAATILGATSLSTEQLETLAPVFASVGPIELKELIPIVKKKKDAGIARTLALELARNPSLISLQESVFRTAFSDHSPELFEQIILPARRSAEVAIDAKKREIGPLAERAATHGNAPAGEAHFARGLGACAACHRIGAIGNSIGPDLSKIGAIRTERDLVESILFPSNTLARDYEAHIIETGDGQSTTGVIRSHTADGLLLVDGAGQEKNIPHEQIVSDTTLPDSLMPMGLDGTMTGQELLDLVAWLRSLR